MEDNKFNEPYISLKFGGIKSMNFTDNKEAEIISNNGGSEIEIIQAYNGNFFFWWEQRWGTKEEAINYILNYQ